MDEMAAGEILKAFWLRVKEKKKKKDIIDGFVKNDGERLRIEDWKARESINLMKITRPWKLWK